MLIQPTWPKCRRSSNQPRLSWPRKIRTPSEATPFCHIGSVHASHRGMVRRFKPFVFLVCLLPLARLGWEAYMGVLGANLTEVIAHSTGDWKSFVLTNPHDR